MIEQIKEALEKATPGPWSMNDMDMYYSNEVFINPTGREYIQIADGMKIEDAHLIAQSPTYIRCLLEELEKAQKELEEYREASKYALEVKDQQLEVEVNDNIRLRTEHTTMKNALEFYADEQTYDIGHLDRHGYIIIDTDNGDKARAVLSTLKPCTP